MKGLTYALLLALALAGGLAEARPKARPPVVPVPVPVPGPGINWHHGHWYHGHHHGRLGWWWVVGPAWHFYDYPVWPYWHEDTRVIVEPEPAPTGPPPPAYWYWCDEPPGYYPYVAQCGVEWKPVLAAAPPPPPEKKK